MGNISQRKGGGRQDEGNTGREARRIKSSRTAQGSRARSCLQNKHGRSTSRDVYTWKAETGATAVQVQPQLHSMVDTAQGHKRACLQQKK